MIWLFVAACGVLTPDEDRPKADPVGRHFQLVYTADVHGEIEPCG